MDKAAISQNIVNVHRGLVQYLGSLDEHSFLFSPAEKWSAAEHLDHLLKSVQPVNLALLLPNFVLKMMFRKANRPSKSYEELVEKYKAKLSAGGKAPKAFAPKKISFNERETNLKKLESLAAAIAKKTNKYSDEDLDTLILPHPLLGKLTLREMLYFTAYHCTHHQQLIKVALAGNEKNNS